MKRVFIVIVICAAGLPLRGQRAVASPGYYPSSYSGDTFTGVVKAVDVNEQSLTIAYDGGKRRETFIGRLERPCAVPSRSDRPLTVADIDIGTHVTAYYTNKPRKVHGKKQADNHIIALTFHTWKGKATSPRPIHYCTGAHTLTFKAW